MFSSGLLYENDSEVEYSFSLLIRYEEYDVLSEDSDTGEIFGFRIM